VVGVVLNLALWSGHKVILPNGNLDFFALISAGASFVLLQKLHMPIHLLVHLGAVTGLIRMIAMQP
jgi:hypothetical protein